MIRRVIPLLFAGLLSAQSPTAPEPEFRTWRALGDFRTEAQFLGYDAGTVRLRRRDGTEISVRIEQLVPQDRAEVLRLAGPEATGSVPATPVGRPTGRRELNWTELNTGENWPDSLAPGEREALLTIGKSWNHAESEFFVIHYQQVGFAKRVARMADFFHQYIAADLPGFEPRVKEKSHIVILRNPKDWQAFLQASRTAPEWSGAYVRGQVMFVQDTGDNETNADVLAHEMSHLVLNRFFARPPPLWLNEGLAEWYETLGWKAFKGQRANPREGLGKMPNPYPLRELTAMKAYPGGTDNVHRFYRTSRQLVGFLKMEKDQQVFVRFLQAVTVRGADVMAAVSENYGFSNLDEWQAAFDKFLR